MKSSGQGRASVSLSSDREGIESPGFSQDAEVAALYATVHLEKKELASQNDDFMVTWNGPNDPELPVNWSSWKIWTNILLIPTFTLLTYVLTIRIINVCSECWQCFDRIWLYQPRFGVFLSLRVSIGLCLWATHYCTSERDVRTIAIVSHLHAFLPHRQSCCSKSTNLTMLIIFDSSWGSSVPALSLLVPAVF